LIAYRQVDDPGFGLLADLRVTIQVPHDATKSNEINRLHEPSKEGSKKTPPIHPQIQPNHGKCMAWRATMLAVTH